MVAVKNCPPLVRAICSNVDGLGGTLMISLLLQLITILPGLGGVRPYLLPEQFNAWQGLLRTPIDWSPIGHAAWVCALYAVPSLVAAYLVFLRRDVAGG